MDCSVSLPPWQAAANSPGAVERGPLLRDIRLGRPASATLGTLFLGLGRSKLLATRPAGLATAPSGRPRPVPDRRSRALSEDCLETGTDADRRHRTNVEFIGFIAEDPLPAFRFESKRDPKWP